MLDDASPLLVGAACDVIGAISRLVPMPLDESNKTQLIKKLLKLSFNPAILSKVKFIVNIYFFYGIKSKFILFLFVDSKQSN